MRLAKRSRALMRDALGEALSGPLHGPVEGSRAAALGRDLVRAGPEHPRCEAAGLLLLDAICYVICYALFCAQRKLDAMVGT
jgi:hypothetical protein